MSLTRLCLLAIPLLCTVVAIRQWKSDTLPLLRVAITVGFGIAAVSALTPVIALLNRLLSPQNAFGADLSCVLKALGVALLSAHCAAVCRECGESALADGVELAGRLEILLLSLPLIESILSTACELLGLGG